MAGQAEFQNSRRLSRRSLLFLGGAFLAQGVAAFAAAPPVKLSAKHPVELPAVKVIRRRVRGIAFFQTTISLTDPDTFVTIGLANNAPQANSAWESYGDESFRGMMQRSRATVVASGTFFSKDNQKRVMGNLVAGGKFLKYSAAENYGTTLGLLAGNVPEMVTARIEGQPDWSQHWLSLTGGPRLLKEGQIWLSPREEGFKDPNVLGVATRAAIGYPRGGKKLVLATFLTRISLRQEAQVMKAIGCYEAMNLDGGSSIALANKGRIHVAPRRELTNVIVVYDATNPAPRKLQESWLEFQQGKRPEVN